MPTSTYASPISFELFEGLIHLQIQSVKAEVGPGCCRFYSVLDDACCQ